MKNLTGVLGAILIFAFQGSVNAALITYNLSDVTFTDGGTATGSFDYDPTTPDGGTFGDFDITTTDGNGDGFPGFHYTTVNSTVIGDQSAFVFGSNDITGNVLYLFTNDNVTGSGSYVITPGPDQSGELSPTDIRDVTGGSIVSADLTTTPEPEGLQLIAVALSVLGVFAVRRKLSLKASIGE